MDDSGSYVRRSLELHLFFARIMKEHALFLQAGFTPACEEFAKEAGRCKEGFEDLLGQAIRLSNGVICRQVLASGELVTEFTAEAERQTQCFTGLPIDGNLTRQEAQLRWGSRNCQGLRSQVQELNQTALRLLQGLIGLKEKILNHVLACKIFTMNYPLLLEHILREAKLYRSLVEDLERGGDADGRNQVRTELFWNQIMMEHAQFIRGLLDPTECELMDGACGFAKDFGELLEKARCAEDQTLVRRESLQEALKFRDFKAAGAKGIRDCRIRSIILPLLADHVLREANHYIRLLNEPCETGKPRRDQK